MVIKVLDVAYSLPHHPTRKYKKRLLGEIERIVVHNSESHSSLKAIARYHVSPGNHISAKGCPQITYHGAVELDGVVKKTLEYNVISWHAGVWNPSSLGICMLYKSTDGKGNTILGPADIQLQNTMEYCARLCLRFKLHPSKVVGHREMKWTGWIPVGKGSRKYRKQCPGKLVDMNEFRHGVAISMQSEMRQKRFYTGLVDGRFGPQSKKALEHYV